VSEHYAFIEAEKAVFPVRRGCKLLAVSTSGFYAWRERPASPTATRRAQIAQAAAAAHEESDGTFGYRRVHSELVASGTVVSVHLVRRVLREQDLHGAQPAAYRVTTKQDPEAAPAPDLLERNFQSDEPGSRLVGDITYIRTWAGWAYLAVVIDLATKMIVGWSISNRASAALVIDALEMAQRNGQLELDAIFHSDRGCQGGFNWWSQHLVMEVVRDGCWQASAGDSGDAWADVVAGPAVGGQAGGSAAVLAGDRRWVLERGRGRRGERFASGWQPVVPRRWRDAANLVGPAVGALSVVC